MRVDGVVVVVWMASDGVVMREGSCQKVGESAVRPHLPKFARRAPRIYRVDPRINEAATSPSTTCDTLFRPVIPEYAQYGSPSSIWRRWRKCCVQGTWSARSCKNID